MEISSRIAAHFAAASQCNEDTAVSLLAPLASAAELLFAAITSNARIFVCGNACSAALAQHFAALLVGRCERERLPLACIALAGDSPLITTVAADGGLVAVFERQINALGQPGDVLLVLTSSGSSVGLQRAVQAAHERDMQVLALSGNGGGELAAHLFETDLHLCVPCERPMRIHEAHLLMLHSLSDAIDAMLLGEST